MRQTIRGTEYRDSIMIGSGSQTVIGGADNDRIISYADAGEPNPAQTKGAKGRDTKPVPLSQTRDFLTGGDGADSFEFHALIDATAEVIAQHTAMSGRTDWGSVAGENDNVHDHWVNGFGFDTVTDYSKAEGDELIIRGHTATISSITYGSDRNGDFSLITVISQQGDGKAGGANTATGAHDEDPLGKIKVYGDKVKLGDVQVQNSNDGIDRLYHADTVFGPIEAGTTQEVYSNTDGTRYSGSLYRQKDVIWIGEGSQVVDAGGGFDRIYSYSDSGEPDPAQTSGATGRVTPALAPGAGDDIIKGGQGSDLFAFRLLLDAKQEILDKHTREDGTINWRKVAGENGNVHDHWVAGIGNDTILDFSNQDEDRIDIRGHTVEIAKITYGTDAGGDFSLIALRSQQGPGGGAHDEDPLGTIKVYGDKVKRGDINVRADVFYGVDDLDGIAASEAMSPASNPDRKVSEPTWGAQNPETIDLTFEGTVRSDTFHAGSGKQTVNGGAEADRLISYADAGEPDPAQTNGAEGRVTPPVPESATQDVFTGGAGSDRFEFHALLNAKASVLAFHTDKTGNVNWREVAGENDNVHDHWVQGFGNDVITDYSKAEGDKIIVRGHTVQVSNVSYGTDAEGNYSLITVISQQGDGGAGGANTATGAHDEDPLGTIKVYGDQVKRKDITVEAANVFDGVDRLDRVDALGDYGGGVQVVSSSTHRDKIVTAPEDIKTADLIKVGSGAQVIEAGAGRDRIFVYADAGEPNPAQTPGARGRVDAPVKKALAADVVSGGQGRDTFVFNMLLDAKDEVLARHTNDDGSINWVRVAGENDGVHDHWVTGIGADKLLDYSKQDGDSIILRGHTVEIAKITYGQDAKGDFSKVFIRSQQGPGGGAHDEDPLGTLTIYGDKVTERDIEVKAKGVFDGVDAFEPMTDLPVAQVGTDGADDLIGTAARDNLLGRKGDDKLSGGDNADFLFGQGGTDTLLGGEGNDWLEGGALNDLMDGGAGNDTIFATSGKDMMIGGAGRDRFSFSDNTRGGVIEDWEDGRDKIMFDRADNVDSIADLTITQTSRKTATISFENDNGLTVEVDLISDQNFTLSNNDFVF